MTTVVQRPVLAPPDVTAPATEGRSKALRDALSIGVDASCWQLPRGFGRHTRCLLTALLEVDRENDYVFFTDSALAAEEMPQAAEVRLVHTSRPTIEGASARGHRRFADLVRMSRALGDPALDVLLFPTVYSYVPVLSGAGKLVMIHDVTAELYPKLTLHSPLARTLWRLKVALGRRQADALITVSRYSRRRIAERFGVPEERIHVVGEAPGPAFRVLDDPRPTPELARLGLGGDERLVVYVGGFSPHKNLLQLVDVVADLAAAPGRADVRLVFVGENEEEAFYSHFEEVKRRVDERGLGARAVFTGFLPDDELVVLLNRATVLALPSLTEGYGLPAVEAAACGCPVVATRESPLPGLLGDAGLWVDPHQPEELRQALERVLESPELRRRMAEVGVAAAGRLDWASAARQLVAVIEGVAAEARR